VAFGGKAFEVEHVVNDQQIRPESKTAIVERVQACLRSGQYSHALSVLRGATAELANDAELVGLEKLSQDGIERTAEAQRLITDSQEMFAQQKSGEAIQLLRAAYELDKKNSLARAILANALVEHAHSFVETDWLEAERLTNQALAVNPAHPTAKTILSQIVDKKEKSSADDWVSHASKLQSSGDLFAALAWVAEGLAVHPDEPKLLHIQDAIQRDRAARGRQTRRRDLDELRKLERQIEGSTGDAAKQALGERIQAVAVRYWTDGEMIAIANGLLHRLGLVDENSSAPAHAKNLPIIFHVPRSNAAKPSKDQSNQVPLGTLAPDPVASRELPVRNISKEAVGPRKTASRQLQPDAGVPEKVPDTVPEPRLSAPAAASALPANFSPGAGSAVGVPTTGSTASAATGKSEASAQKEHTGSKPATLVLICSAAAIILLAAVFFFTFFTHKDPVREIAKIPSPAPIVSAPEVSQGAVQSPAASASATPGSAPSLAVVPAAAEARSERNAIDDRPSEPTPVQMTVEPGHKGPAQNESSSKLGTLVVVAGQDNARVLVDGKVQRQLTQSGQLRLPNLELKNYVIQVSKSGFQDPPQQEVRIREGEQARVIFNLQPQPKPQPRLASLIIQGGVPGTTVLVDQSSVGSVQPDGTLSVSTVNPGDHTVELRKEQFKTRDIKKHFVAGEAISLASAEVALEAAPGELKITFAPADARVALVKGDLLTIVTSGAPLNLPAGTYTLTTRTADKFTRSSTLDVVSGHSKSLDLSLAPSGMSKWDDPGGWKSEGDSFVRKGGDFVLYGVPAGGTFVFSAMPAKGHVLQWVVNYTDSKNYVLFRMDDDNFYRTVIRNGEKRDEIIVPDRADKKSFRALHIHVSPTEIVHQIRHGNSWTVLDRWTQPGTNLSLGKFGFYIPGNDQVAVSTFAHYADLANY
jgi:tetratricopeptide (TPR) repeat protein